MEGKSKTFVRGFVPKFTRRPKKSKLGKSDKGDATHDSRQNASSAEGEHLEVYDGIEYDDATPVEEVGGLFHHYGSKRPHWKMSKWEDLKVGDFVKILDGEPIPADILLCASSEDENVAFIETKNLDGETNLKSRTASSTLTHLRSAQTCANPKHQFTVDCDRPDTNLYRLNAAVVGADGQKAPVDIQMVLLRGTVLRNTKWAIGVVLYTGEDTKIVMNSGDTPSKRSKVERQMNPQVYACSVAYICCRKLTSVIASSIWAF